MSQSPADMPSKRSEFSRPIRVNRLPKSETFRFDETATPDECAALAKLLGARSVAKLRIRGELRPLDTSGWQLVADLGATVTQSCVVTLAPVKTRIDTKVTRRFVSVDDVKDGEIDIDPDQDDEVEPLDRVIDPGQIATEAISLALPDYPRAPGASLDSATTAASGPPERKPFAELEVLRDKLKKDQEH